jgi:HSP20 family protein
MSVHTFWIAITAGTHTLGDLNLRREENEQALRSHTEDDMMRLMTVRPRRRWDPWREMFSMRTEMDRVFGGFVPVCGEKTEVPAINVTRSEDRVVLEAVAPGIDRSTLDVTAMGNTVTISGERKAEPDVKPEAYKRRERAGGRFVRKIKVGERVTTENISATYRDGVLRIELPYAPEAKPRKVTVTA